MTEYYLFSPLAKAATKFYSHFKFSFKYFLLFSLCSASLYFNPIVVPTSYVDIFWLIFTMNSWHSLISSTLFISFVFLIFVFLHYISIFNTLFTVSTNSFILILYSLVMNSLLQIFLYFKTILIFYVFNDLLCTFVTHFSQ